MVDNVTKATRAIPKDPERVAGLNTETVNASKVGMRNLATLTSSQRQKMDPVSCITGAPVVPNQFRSRS